MNSFINVQIRILASQAQARLAAVQTQLSVLAGAGFGGATASTNKFGSAISSLKLDSFGSRIQWIGRQIEYNFTIPILAAAAASFKLALDNEAAFTRVIKVYGDAAHGADFYAKEIKSLEKNFVALSNTYGISLKETNEIGAAWAAAGSQGLALAKSVDLTMQTMILGEMNAADATSTLISIQAQYGQTVDELTDTIGILNMVENQTGISLKGLVEGFQRAAGVARSAGVDVRHLAAMLAALTPAAGSAAQAGNALKTIFSRLLSPTKETVEVLGLMGIHIGDLSWKSANMVDRLKILSNSFEKLSSSQKNVVSAVVASRWQINKFDILMRELSSTTGYYQRALDSTAKKQDYMTQLQRELNTVLSSNPRRLQIIWTMLQNAAADIIQPMIPLLLYLAQAIQKVVQKFSELSPGTQKFIISLLLLLAVVGPAIRYIGAFTVLFAELGKAFLILLAPIRLAGAALWGFLGLIANFFRMGLIPLLTRASTAIMAAITGPWGIALGIVITLLLLFWDDIKTIIGGVIDGIVAGWNTLPAAIKNSMLAVVNIVRTAVMKVYELLSYLNPWARHSPSLVDNVTTGVAEIIRQFGLLSRTGSIFQNAGVRLNAFAISLSKIRKGLDEARTASLRNDLSKFAPELLGDFDKMAKVLRSMKDEMAKLQKELPLEKMKALDDAIFANQMQQKKLRLEMMKMEDVVGPFDKLQSRLEQIAGQIELLKGEQKSLRDAGAGSEILSQYDAQISALEDQQAAINSQVKPIADLQDQIEKLERTSQEMDLQQALQIDPIVRQMDELKDAIGAVEEAMRSMSEVAQSIGHSRGMSPGAENFLAAAGGNFPDVGGTGQLGREGGIADQSAMIDEFTKTLADKTKNMFGLFDFLEPIKKGWHKVEDWWNENIAPAVGAMWDKVEEAFSKVENPFKNINVGGAIDTIKDSFDTFKNIAKDVWTVIGPPLKDIGDILKEGWAKAVKEIGPELAKFKDLVGPTGDALKKLWDIVKPFVIEIGSVLVVAISNTVSVFKNVLGPTIDFVIGLIKNLIKVIRGIIEFLLGVFTGDFSKAWQGIQDIFGGFVGWFKNSIKFVIDFVIGVIRGFGESAGRLFALTWSKIKDGVKDVAGWITDKWNGIVDWFKKLPDKIADIGSKAWSGLKDGFKWAVNGIIDMWNKLADKITGFSFLGIEIPGLPHINKLARGGFVTRGATAIVGEGRKGYPEFVIPTDPAYRANALRLLSELMQTMGMRNVFGRSAVLTMMASDMLTGGGMASGGTLGKSRPVSRDFGSQNVTYNFYGNLEFPNVKDGEDAEDFIKNLEALVGR